MASVALIAHGTTASQQFPGRRFNAAAEKSFKYPSQIEAWLQRRDRLCRLLAAIVVAALACTTAPAIAQQTSLEASFHRAIELYSAGKYAEAAPLAEQAAELALRTLGAKHPNYAVTLKLMGDIDRDQGRYAEAQALYQRSLGIFEDALGRTDAAVVGPLNGLAILHQMQGHYSDAEPLLRRCLAILESTVGSKHPDVAVVLDNLSNIYQMQGRYSEAEPLVKRALEINEASFGPMHREVGTTANNLALLYEQQGRYAEAEALMKRGLLVRETALGPIHQDVAASLSNLSNLYREQGRYSEAEPLLRRSLDIFEQVFGPEHPEVAAALNNLAMLYAAQGRYAEAETLDRRSLAIREKTLGAEHVATADSMNNLATRYDIQGRDDEAEPLYERALEIYENALGRDHPKVAMTLHNLASLYNRQGARGMAERLFKRSLAISEATLGPSHPDVAQSLNSLANVFKDQGRYAEAEPLYLRSIGIREKALGPSHPDFASSLHALATLYYVQGRYGEAESLYKRSLAIREGALGASHPSIGNYLRSLGLLDLKQRRFASAYQYLRRAMAIGIGDPGSGMNAPKSRSGLWESRVVPFDFITAAWNLAQVEPARREELTNEAFVAAQFGESELAGAGLAQLAVRFQPSSPALARLIREKQDAELGWQLADRKFTAAVSRPASGQSEAIVATLRAGLAAADQKLTEVSARIADDFPGYAELTSAKPQTTAVAQRLIGADEALVVFLTATVPGGLIDTDETFVWAVTREGVAWLRIPIGNKTLDSQIAALRRGLSLDLEQPPTGATGGKFDLNLAYELYATLLRPIEGQIKSKHHLILVPSGPLVSLPFHLLVTEPARTEKAEAENLSRYRKAVWLSRRHATTIVPSVSSLRILREVAKSSPAPKPFIGFGDPALPRSGTAVIRAAKAKSSRQTLSYASYWRGADVDPEALASLDPLPEAADELKAVAGYLGAPLSEVHLGSAATKMAVKNTDLTLYRIIYFATHGLMAGDVRGLGEPALVLSFPAQPTELDDGLLTASEIAQLKLNADWVVLSACNTAAADKPGAEAFSGLVRAFFYAGARALLVSHWPVDSQAAVRLMTLTFEALKADRSIGRAEALRRAMIAYIEDTSDPRNAIPSFWGPFLVVGEGGSP
jgi:tetratricopeptide (TPR) repeat protein/CHAT domain-containing protein